MNLSSYLELERNNCIISVAGGGGKTTTLFTLASDLKDYKVLVTTTTKILKPEISDSYEIVTGKSSSEFLDYLENEDHKNIVVYGLVSDETSRKLEGCSFTFLDEVKNYFDYIIIEADGSAGRPLKAPAAHEPVIYNQSDIYIGVIGLDCLGKAANESYVHRPEYFSQIRQKQEDDKIIFEDLISLINSPVGLFKNAPEKCRKIVLLNKGDLISVNEREILANKIIDQCLFPLDLIINSYKESESVLLSKQTTILFN